MTYSDDEPVVVDDSAAWQESNDRKRKRALSIGDDPPMSIPRKRKIVAKIPCNICLEDFTLRTIIRLNCDCQLAICRACFNSWVSNSGDLPECCSTKMEYLDYEHILSAVNKRKISLHADELADPNPIHCNSCHGYLRLKEIKDEFSTCGKCKTKTCRACGQLKKDHMGIHSICPGDVADPELDKLSTELGWKKCPKCFARIEKTVGCNGMRCRCGCEFMYCCGLRKHLCNCRQNALDEAIVAELEEIVTSDQEY